MENVILNNGTSPENVRWSSKLGQLFIHSYIDSNDFWLNEDQENNNLILDFIQKNHPSFKVLWNDDQGFAIGFIDKAGFEIKSTDGDFLIEMDTNFKNLMLEESH